MHLWCAISAISACLGRRCWYQTGTSEIWPNMYVCLVGPPGARKSTAIGLAARLVRENTGVRFAPDDTGGQRQGFISAMNDIDLDEKETDRVAEALIEIETKGETFNGISSVQAKIEAISRIDIDTRDPRTMYIAASELNSILGENNTALLTFFCKMYDGDPYEYRLKNATHKLANALIGLLGGTTPQQIAIALPPEAIGQGFTSRVIFVYGDLQSDRRIARPSLNLEAGAELSGILRKIFYEFGGPFREDDAAAQRLDSIYMRGIVLRDPRFVHYTDRRHTHLQKLSMVLAASRGDMLIREHDIILADQILLYTEEKMSDALGEYGMNKLGAAKQRLMDFLKTATDPIPNNALFGLLSRDMSQLDFKNIIAELHNAKKITIVTLPQIGQCVIPVADTEARRAGKGLDELTSLLRVVK